MLNEQERIELVTQTNLNINQTKDLDLLLEKILTNARKILNADAGSIYLSTGDKLEFSYTQNETLQRKLPVGQKLIYNTFTIPIDDGSIAGYAANNNKMLNIPDVYLLNTTVPYAFNTNFDEVSHYKTRSMLTVPMVNQRNQVLGVMQIINAKDEDGKIISFSKAATTIIKHYAASAAIAVERAQMTREIILRMVNLAELRDPTETGAHANRVGAYAVEIYEQWARKKKIDADEINRKKDLLRMAAMLHDVGKVAISDMILKKPGKLTSEEFANMQTHTYLGAKLFQNSHSELDILALEIALNHHEKWDGTGYPGYVDIETGESLPEYSEKNGKAVAKKGEEIPVMGRIVAVADVFDALRSRRTYKKSWDEDKVLEEMKKSSGRSFDPEIVEAFFACYEVLKAVAARYPETNC